MSTDNKIDMAGKHRAKVIDHQFGYAGRDNKPQVALMFELTEDGPLKGRTISWFGFFTPDTKDRTFDSLRYCGWDNDDLEQLDSVRKNEVEIVIENSTYEGVTKPKVRWVNRVGRRTLDLKVKMEGSALRNFAAEMRAEAAARRAESPGGRNGQSAATQSHAPRDANYGPPSNYEDDDQLPF